MSPSKILTKLLPILVFLAGVINIVSSLWAKAIVRMAILMDFVPLYVSNLSRTFTVWIGLILIFLSFGLWAQKKRAWLLSLVCFIPVIATNLIKGLDIEEAIVNGIILFLLFRYRRYYSVDSQPVTEKSIIRLAAITFLSAAIYANLGFFALGKEFKEPVTLPRAVNEYVYIVAGYGHEQLFPSTHRTRWLYESIFVTHTLAIIIFFPALFAPAVSRRFVADKEREDALSLISRKSLNSVSPMAGMTDKQYFFNLDHTCLIAYRISGKFAVVLGDPIGYEEEKSDTIKHFEEYCFHHGLKAIWYSVDPTALHLYPSYRSLMIGEEAVIKLKNFDLKTSRLKNVRNAVSKAQKDGINFSWYKCSELPWRELQQINSIHQSWLSQKKIPPMSFSMEYFPFPVDQESYVVVGKLDNELVCYLSLFPYKRGMGYALDLMIRSINSGAGVMEAAIVEAINHFKNSGVEEVNLSLAPFVTSEEVDKRGLSRNDVLDIISRWYKFRPLREFKDKFAPQWRPKYLVYKNQADLPGIALALLRVHLRKEKL